MLFASEQTTEQMTHLFSEAQNYWQLQKKYLSLHSSEVLSRLFSTIALWAIFILVGFMILLFASFAVAIWIGQLLDSQIAGFAIIAGVLALGTFLVYVNRMSWIVLPTTRFMVSLLASELIAPTKEAITLEKSHLRQQLNQNEDELRSTASAILSPLPESKNKWENVTQLFQNGLSVYRGIQLGLSVIAAARTLFKKGKRKSR